jgi:hypothetical protein
LCIRLFSCGIAVKDRDGDWLPRKPVKEVLRRPKRNRPGPTVKV